MDGFDDPVWQALGEELEHWRTRGDTVTFWWRDDDAVEPTSELERLLELRSRFDIPLALAVIPATATTELNTRLMRERAVHVLQHGFAHRNHAPPSAKKSEFPDGRNAEAVQSDIAQGFDRVSELFPDLFLPVFVPPWNRISRDARDYLGQTKIEGLSTFTSRLSGLSGRLRIANCHMDPIYWRGEKRFVGDQEAVGTVIRHLEARSTGRVDALEPTGLLTHHLVSDERTWRFLEQFFRFTRMHAGVRWLSPRDVFSLEQ